MSYSANLTGLFHRSATYVDKILKGRKPADLPVEQPTKFELVINLKAAKADPSDNSAKCIGKSRQGNPMIERSKIANPESRIVRGCVK